MNQNGRILLRRSARAATFAALFLSSAALWLCLCLFIGAACMFFGIESQFGTPWALIFLGALALVVAFFIFVGIARNG